MRSVCARCSLDLSRRTYNEYPACAPPERMERITGDTWDRDEKEKIGTMCGTGDVRHGRLIITPDGRKKLLVCLALLQRALHMSGVLLASTFMRRVITFLCMNKNLKHTANDNKCIALVQRARRTSNECRRTPSEQLEDLPPFDQKTAEDLLLGKYSDILSAGDTE